MLSFFTQHVDIRTQHARISTYGVFYLYVYSICLLYIGYRGGEGVTEAYDTLDTMIGQLLKASMNFSTVSPCLETGPEGIPVETPSRTAQLDKEYYTGLPGRLFARLARLPGKALVVYMVLRRRSRLDHTATVPLSTVALGRFGITRWQKDRALACLEAAQLITVDRTHGKNPRVTLRAEDVPWVQGSQPHAGPGPDATTPQRGPGRHRTV